MVDRTTPTLEQLWAVIQERQVAAEQRFEAQEKATEKAVVALERRFESVNEFRATLSDQQRSFMPRPEYEAQHRTLVQQVELGRDRLVKLEQSFYARKDGMSYTGSVILGIFAVLTSLAGILAIFTHH